MDPTGDYLTAQERVTLLRAVHDCETLSLMIERMARAGTVSDGSRELLRAQCEVIRKRVVGVAEA